LGDICIDGKIILKWYINKLEGVDWIHLAQDRNKWQALLKMVMNSCPIKGREFLGHLNDYQLLKNSEPWSK
jgi:hypothetical protein